MKFLKNQNDGLLIHTKSNSTLTTALPFVDAL